MNSGMLLMSRVVHLHTEYVASVCGQTGETESTDVLSRVTCKKCLRMKEEE